MGTISSVSKEINNNKITDSQDESSEYSLKNINSIIQSQGQSETRENTKVTVIKDQKIPFKFEWKDGGNEVLLTGSKKDSFMYSISDNYYEKVYGDILKKVPNGRMNLFDSGDHPAMLTNPDSFYDLSMDFLA